MKTSCGGLDQVVDDLLRVVRARERHHDLVVALRLDLGLGDAERVDAAPDDLDGAVDGLGGDLAGLRRLPLEHHLDAALEVQAEHGGAERDGDDRRGQEAGDDRDEEERAPHGRGAA